MNDVSVREIAGLYSFRSQINNFTGGLDSVRWRLQSAGEEQINHIDILISRIKRAQERLQRQIHQTEAAIFSLQNSLYGVEDEHYRNYILDDIDAKEDELNELEDELSECEDDLSKSENLLSQAQGLSETITQEAIMCVSEAQQRTDNACHFIDKLIYHLQNAQR